MSGTINGHYLETEVLSADPVKLVALLYRGAIEAVAAARRHLLNGEIRERSRQITKAYDITHELMRALDHDAGGEVSRNLQSLYIYMQNRLLEANAKQIEAPLAEVERLLYTLAEAWRNVPAQHHPAHTEEHEYTPISCSY